MNHVPWFDRFLILSCGLIWAQVLLAQSAAAVVAADPFLGSFITAAGETRKIEFKVEWGDRDDAYKGTIRLNSGKLFPFTAHRNPNDAHQITGAFESDGQSLDFTAMASEGRIKFSTGRSVFALAPLMNPLDPPDEHPQAGAGAAGVCGALVRRPLALKMRLRRK